MPEKTYIWREESRGQFQVSYGTTSANVGIVHTAAAAAAAKLVVLGYENHDHTNSVPVSWAPAKKGPPIRRNPLTTDLIRLNIARARVLEWDMLIVLPRVAAVRRIPYTNMT